MNRELTQHLRYKLQKRVGRLNQTTGSIRYKRVLVQFWDFITKEPVIFGIVDQLEKVVPEADTVVSCIEKGEGQVEIPTEVLQAAVSRKLIVLCLEDDESDSVYSIITNYLFAAGESSPDYSEAAETFHEMIVMPLYEWIDESLDDNRAILSILTKYKQRTEWFKRRELSELLASETMKGERNLSLDLYEFLHGEGLSFSIEPTSASGEADLVVDREDSESIIADAKIFSPDKSKSKSYLCNGFHQVYRYTEDFNQPFGYLIIFKASATELRFALTGSMLSFPYVIHNGKTIYFVVIDIHMHETTASKRGKLTAVEITEKDLVVGVGESGV